MNRFKQALSLFLSSCIAFVEADRWVQSNPSLKGDQLAQAVDQQNWYPSVKALTAFPSVLANLDKNLSWTTSLGEAYTNTAS